RLVTEFIASRRDDPLVAWGRATDGAHRSSLRVWRQVVQALEDRPGMSGSPRAAPDAAEDVLDQDRAVLAMVERVTALVRATGAAVIVVIEDLHWVDDASLQVARVLLNEMTDVPALFVITVRDDERDQSPSLAATMAELARCGAQRVDIPPLTPEEVQTYVAAVTRSDDPGTAARVFARTSGHPFFVVELVRLVLGADGRHALEEDSHDVPSGVRDVVRARVARLPGPTRSVLAAAAVLGEHATLDLVEAAGGVAQDRMLDAVEPALVTRFIEFSSTEQPLLFAHSLIRQAVSDEVTTLRRARMLASAAVQAGTSWAGDSSRASALADLSLTAAEAGAFPVTEAVGATRSAVGPLHNTGSYGEAAALLQRAARLSTTCPWQQHHDLLVNLSGSQLRAGDLKGWSATVQQSLETALEHRDWQAAGRSLLDVGAPWSHLSYGRVRARTVELLTDLADLAPVDSPQGQRVKALASAALAAELYFSRDTQRCADLSASAVSLARRVGDASLFARVVALREMAVWDSNGASARIALRREAIGRGLTPDDEARPVPQRDGPFPDPRRVRRGSGLGAVRGADLRSGYACLGSDAGTPPCLAAGRHRQVGGRRGARAEDRRNPAADQHGRARRRLRRADAQHSTRAGPARRGTRSAGGRRRQQRADGPA
ncbi:MAG: hypothetical protein ACJ72A_06830, partial [Nocardioidaceae bacterium]